MERLGSYAVRRESVLVGGERYELLLPADPDALLDDPHVRARFERDEYMPYWATLWPGAVLLAEFIAGQWPVQHAGPPVLELGCGVGLVGLVAARLGYRVILADYDQDALRFAAENARLNGLDSVVTRLTDWRHTYDDLHVERILAADVLYESRNLEPLAGFIARHLTPGGMALVCDANRRTADPFADVARGVGLEVTVRSVCGVTGGTGVPMAGRIYHLHKPSAG